MAKKLSVIISNRNDVTILVVTLRSCIEEFRPLGLKNCEIMICDNSDLPQFERIKAAIPSGYCRDKTIRIVHQTEPCLFAARETAAERAIGEYIVCVDSHVIIGHNMLLDMVNFMERHSDNKKMGFAHAPISWAHQHECRARHDRNVAKHELGPWGAAYKHERRITWKGMPWICRRDWFLDRDKGLNGYGALRDHMVSWGGGDMHIGVKPWLLGFENWAVPTNACVHIGPFPKTDIHQGKASETIVSDKIDDLDKYRVYAKSGNFPHAFGFLVSCYILGGEAMMSRNREAIKNRFGRFIDVDAHWDIAKKVGTEEREWLKARQVMSFDEFLERQPWND